MNDIAQFEWQRTFKAICKKHPFGIIWMKEQEIEFAEALRAHANKHNLWSAWYTDGMRFFQLVDKSTGKVIEKWFEYRGRRLDFLDYERINGGFGGGNPAKAIQLRGKK